MDYFRHSEGVDLITYDVCKLPCERGHGIEISATIWNSVGESWLITVTARKDSHPLISASNYTIVAQHKGPHLLQGNQLPRSDRSL